MTEQEIRATALKIAQQMNPGHGVEDLTDQATMLADWIAVGSMDARQDGIRPGQI